MVYKVRGVYGRRAIAVVEMRDNEDSGDRDTVIWIRRQRRRGTGNRRDAGRRRYRFWRRSIAMGVDASQHILPIGGRKGGIGLGIGASGEDGERGGWEIWVWREYGDNHSSSQYQDLYGGHDGGIMIVFVIVGFFLLGRGGLRRQ